MDLGDTQELEAWRNLRKLYSNVEKTTIIPSIGGKANELLELMYWMQSFSNGTVQMVHNNTLITMEKAPKK